MTPDPVVITGIGLVTPLGSGPREILARLRRGDTAARPPDRFDPAGFSCPLYAPVEGFDAEALLGDSKTLRLMNHDAVFAVAAARLALRDANLQVGRDYPPAAIALFGATGLAGIALPEVAPLIRYSAGEDGTFDPRIFGRIALNRVRPTLSFKILSNMPICFVSIFENLQGPNAVYNPWEGQGAAAVIAGLRALQEGRADCALVGGCDVKAHELAFVSLQQQGIFASWDKTGKGVIPGEGAAFLVLEREERALARGAHPYARLAGAALVTCPVVDQPPADRPAAAGAPGPTGLGAADPASAMTRPTATASPAPPPPADPLVALLRAATDRPPATAHTEGSHDVPISLLVSAADGDPVFGNREAAALQALGWAADGEATPAGAHGRATANGADRAGLPGLAATPRLAPKPLLGNLFAAAAPAHLALGALAAGEAGGRVLVSCLGFGSQQAAFSLEPMTSRSTPPGALPAVMRSAALAGRHRVVVTGLGIVGPVGNDVPTFWRNLTAGRSGTGPLTLFDASGLLVGIGAEVKDFDPDRVKGWFPAAARDRDRKVLLGLAAAREAMQAAGLATPAGPATPAARARLDRAALHVGVSLEVFFLEDVTPLARQGLEHGAMARLLLGGAPGRPPLQTPLDRLAELIGDAWGFAGPRSTNCSACAAGAMVVGEAFTALREGHGELALAGAADSMLNPLGLGGFSLLRALSVNRDRPEAACRPFDAGRDGTVLGEGAAFLVLETLDHARARGAKPLAEILGYGTSLDAYRVSDPDPGGRGAVLAMRAALADAGLDPAAIDVVNAHGTGTPKNDVTETLAIKEVFGDRARRIPVHAVKSMTGHMIAASGAVEALVSVLTLRDGLVPPTINLDTPDPDCDLDYVPGRARPCPARTVLSNSFAFGGQNASLIFGAIPEGDRP
ncbi:MAG: hypothetical protein GX442_20835 [Candidatus Riflebacteria bacterium]|nr:hypothetical protein [Candidatus Riflebacteria bacterium]